jgi:O-antigen/teichoic acid export membrane protein
MWPIALSIIFNVVYLKGDILLLSFYRSQQEVGMYGAAYRVLDIVTQIAMLTMGILLPLLAGSFARGVKQEFKTNYDRAVILMLLLGIPMATGMFILAGPIMQLVAGTEFALAEEPLQILSVAVFGLFLGAIYGHSAVALNRQKQTLAIYISAAVLTLAGYLFFIPRYGMIGAAWMSVFSELYVGILLFITIHRFIKLPLPYSHISKIILSTFVMGVVTYFFKSLPVLLTISIAGVVYALALIGTKAISKETIKEIISYH